MEADCYLTIPHHSIFPNDIRYHRRHSENDQLPLLDSTSSTKEVSTQRNSKRQQGDVNYRSKSEEIEKLPSKLLNRPSTAVRNRVKKISDDFTIAQTNFENSRKINTVIISIERPKSITPRLPKSLSSARSSCAKCEFLCNNSSREYLLPQIVSTEKRQDNNLQSLPACEPTGYDTSVQQSHSLAVSSDNNIDEHPSPSRGSPTSPPKGSPPSPTLRVDGRRHRSCSPRHRPSLSASSSPRLQHVTLAQLKKTRKFTERAIKVIIC